MLQDLLLCTFQGDTATPPTNYVGEITSIDTGVTTVDFRLVDSGQQFTFNYAAEPWRGTDASGTSYILSSHNVYTGGRIDPFPGGVAQVTFADNKRYLCYVDSVDPSIDIIFYHYPCPRLSFENNIITRSDWDAYAAGDRINQIEGCNLNDDVIPGARPADTATTDEILQIAARSQIMTYRWKDRGLAPAGYIKGMAMMYARVYCKLMAGDAAAIEMAKADTGNEERDGLAWYKQQFDDAGLDNSRDGADTLRHLFVLLIGLGMRESSGQYCEGRDRSASNTTAETAEAGLFQTSYNARTASTLLPQLFTRYAGSSDFLGIFREGVRCSERDLENFGTGDGQEFQRLSKACPAFAVEFTAVALRNRRKHWGPINQRAAEIRTESDAMLQEVQKAVDDLNLCGFLQQSSRQ